MSKSEAKLTKARREVAQLRLEVRAAVESARVATEILRGDLAGYRAELARSAAEQRELSSSVLRAAHAEARALVVTAEREAERILRLAHEEADRAHSAVRARVELIAELESAIRARDEPSRVPPQGPTDASPTAQVDLVEWERREAASGATEVPQSQCADVESTSEVEMALFGNGDGPDDDTAVREDATLPPGRRRARRKLRLGG